LGGAVRTIDVQAGALASQNPNAVGLNPTIWSSAPSSQRRGGRGPDQKQYRQPAAHRQQHLHRTHDRQCGTLLIDGVQTGSTITVNAGAALGGIGTTGRSSWPAAASTRRPDHHPRHPEWNLSRLQQLRQSHDSNIGSSTGGLSNDLLNLSAALTLGGTSTLTLDLNGLTSSTGAPSPSCRTAAAPGHSPAST